MSLSGFEPFRVSAVRGFRVEGLGFRVWGSSFRVQGLGRSGFRVFRVQFKV